MKTYTLLILVAGIGLMFGPHAFAQTTPCPPGSGGSQRASSGQTTQNKSSSTQAPSNKSAPPKNAPAQHQAGRKGYGGHSRGGGVGFGVGATIDLGGIGQRRAEPDPFAISSKTTLPPKTASGEEKVRSGKRPHHKSSDDDLWSQINPIAKEIPEPRSAVADEPKPGRPQ